MLNCMINRDCGATRFCMPIVEITAVCVSVFRKKVVSLCL